jgi:hypothetical protein
MSVIYLNILRYIKSTMKLPFLVTLLYLTQAINQVILSSNISTWNEDQLNEQYNLFSNYTKMQIITTASILVYTIDENGTLSVYGNLNTSDPHITIEAYQMKLKQLNLRSVPTIYCTGNITDRLRKLYKFYDRKNAFIDNSVQKAVTFGYNGFILNIQPEEKINWYELSAFIVKWSHALKSINIPVYLTINCDTFYDHRVYNEADNIIILSVDTYTDNYDDFVEVADYEVGYVPNVTRIGFGLLTNGNMSSEDALNVTKWLVTHNVSLLSAWLDIINDMSYQALFYYLNSN